MKARVRLLPVALAVGLADLCAAPAAHGQTIVGPGSVSTTVVGSSGETTVVGNTTIATGTNDGVLANGGTVTLDMRSPGPGGSIAVQTTSGRALHATNGLINVPAGINVLVNGRGQAAYADGGTINLVGGNVSIFGIGKLAGATAGTINITSTAYNAPDRVSGAQGNGIGVDLTGQVVLGSGNRMYIGRTGNSFGLGAQGPNAGITVNGSLPITFSQSGALGIYLYDGGQLVANAPISLVFNGANSVGLTIDSGTNNQTLSNISATFNGTTGVAGTGLATQRGGNVSVQNLVVNGPGVGIGVWVRDTSTVTLSGSSRIEATAARNAQMYTFAPTTSMAGVDAIFSGATGTSTRAAGLVQGGTLRSTGTTWSNVTDLGYGIFLGQSGRISVVDLTGDTVSATGTRSATVATYANAIFTARGSTIRNDSGYQAIQLWNYGSATQTTGANEVHLIDSTVTATGGADAVYSLNQAPGTVNLLTVQGGSVRSDSTSVYASGPLTVQLGSIEVVGTDALFWAGNALAGADPTVLDVTARGSILSGMAGASAPGATTSTANLRLLEQSTWTGRAFNLTNAWVDPTSVWSVNGESTVSQLVGNDGRIAFTLPENDVYKRLYTTTYTGGVGSVLALNTWLADDASPTDQLVIDGGAANGQSVLEVANSGGAGALTLGDGIRVVAALNGGTTAAGSFVLPAPVLAGPYEYRLHRGGYADGAGEEWFLRSSIDCGAPNAPSPPCPDVVPPQPEPPEPPEPPPSPDPPGPPAPDPDPEPLPPPVVPVPTDADPSPPSPFVPDPLPVPDYRAEVSLYTALPAMALRYGWATLGNLHERVGEQEQLRQRDDLRQDRYFNGAWLRVIGENGDVKGSRRGIYGGSPRYDYDILAVQLGSDIYALERENGIREHAGFYLGRGHLQSDVVHHDGTLAGRNKVKATSLGLYWTRYWEDGQYLDAVWQGSWGDGKSRSSNAVLLERDTFGWGASVEGGYPFWNDARTRLLEPQLQLIYQRIPTDDDQDAAARVRFDDMTSLAARLGLRWAGTRTLEPTNVGIRRLLSGWLRLNVWHEFQGQPVTEFSSANGYVPFKADLKGTWWQLNAGLTWQMGASTSAYANIGYQKSFERDFDAWDGKVGVRWNW